MVNLKWWLIFCLSALGIAYAGYIGLLNVLWVVDATKLSFVTLTLYLGYSMFIGYLGMLDPVYRSNQERIASHLPIGWYVAELLMGFGMMGTIIGFLIMLYHTFSGLDATNATVTSQLLSNAAVGLSTACVTTLVGLACSLLIKLQLVNLEFSLREYE